MKLIISQLKMMTINKGQITNRAVGKSHCKGLIMIIQVLRKGKLFYMKDGRRLVPLSPEAYKMAINDKIQMVKETGDHGNFTYDEMMEVLEGILENDQIEERKSRNAGDKKQEERHDYDY